MKYTEMESHVKRVHELENTLREYEGLISKLQENPFEDMRITALELERPEPPKRKYWQFSLNRHQSMTYLELSLVQQHAFVEWLKSQADVIRKEIECLKSKSYDPEA